MYGKRLIRNLPGVSRCRGFTLIELLVASIVGLLVLAGVHRIFVAGLTTQNITSLESEVNRRAQVAMDDMMDRLRGSYGVREAGLDRIWFLDQDQYDVCYRIQSGKLYRSGSYSGGIPVASDVSQLRFSYYDANGQATSDVSRIVRVVAALEVARGGQSARLESAVRLRNK